MDEEKAVIAFVNRSPTKKAAAECGCFFGGQGGSRTHKPFRAKDFKSSAYTIPPPARDGIRVSRNGETGNPEALHPPQTLGTLALWTSRKSSWREPMTKKKAKGKRTEKKKTKKGGREKKEQPTATSFAPNGERNVRKDLRTLRTGRRIAIHARRDELLEPAVARRRFDHDRWPIRASDC